MKLRAYAEKTLQDSTVVGSHAMPCESIEDLRAFQALTSVAMAMNSRIPRLEMEGRAAAPGMELGYTSDEPAEHPYLSGKTFRSEEQPSELTSLMRIPYAVSCLKKKKTIRAD